MEGSSEAKATSCASWKNAMPRRRSVRSRKSTAASTRSTWHHFSMRSGNSSKNAQGEYYLTDLVAVYRRRKLAVDTLLIDDPARDSWHQQPFRTGGSEQDRDAEKERGMMAAGVTLIDPATTYIDLDAEIMADTVIHPGAIIEGAHASAPAAKSRDTCASPTRRSAIARRSTAFA
jgi:bifunctional UDP-N-acetylglucosamine pyrophosphorylase/glucosamine-1-phosphate N-acetyltransferase